MIDFKVVKSPLGVRVTPFGSSEKCVAIPLLAAGISALGSVAGSAINAGAQSSANNANLEMNRATNETNRQIARETNEMSQAQFNSNMNWLREQFYTQHQYDLDTRNYNDPVNMVQRYRMAGINPVMAMANGSPAAANTVSAVGAPSQSQFQTGYAEAGHVDPVQIDATGLGESVGHSVNAFFQNQLIDAQANRERWLGQIDRVNAAFAVQDKIADLNNKMADTEQKLAQRGLTDAQREVYIKNKEQLQQAIDLTNQTWNDLVNRAHKENSLMDANEAHVREQVNSEKLQQNLMRIEANWKPLLNQAQIRLSNAQSKQILDSLPLIAEQINNEIKTGQIRSLEAAKMKMANELSKLDIKWARAKDSAKVDAAPLFIYSDALSEMLFKNIKFFK